MVNIASVYGIILREQNTKAEIEMGNKNTTME